MDFDTEVKRLGLRKANHKYALIRMIQANPDQPIKFTVGFNRGRIAAQSYLINPDKLPTSPGFFLSNSMFARGFRSGFCLYAGQKVYNMVQADMLRRSTLEHIFREMTALGID